MPCELPPAAVNNRCAGGMTPEITRGAVAREGEVRLLASLGPTLRRDILSFASTFDRLGTH